MQINEEEAADHAPSAQSVRHVPDTAGPHGRPQALLGHLQRRGRFPEVEGRAALEGTGEAIWDGEGGRGALTHGEAPG